MISYIIKRLIFMIPLLIGITIICFVVMHLAPGSPTDMETQMNPRVSAEMKERLRAMYDLDKPLHQQYLIWVKKLLVLDLGTSFSSDHRPVADKILERLPITILLNILSMLLILLMMILFGVQLGWLPISGIRSLNYEYLPAGQAFLDLIKHLVMPVLLSAFGGLAGFSRYMRANMLEVIRQDYITTARAKGLPEWIVIYKHALRNALLPLVTILGLSVPGLIGGSVIFETIFAIPGMGQLFYMAVMARDYPTVMGILFIGAVLTLLGNLLADISYALVDPRIRVS
jgi:peptide/nickel transport system permease protein